MDLTYYQLKRLAILIACRKAPERWEKGTIIDGENVGGQFKTLEDINKKIAEDRQRLENLQKELDKFGNPETYTATRAIEEAKSSLESLKSIAARLDESAGDLSEVARREYQKSLDSAQIPIETNPPEEESKGPFARMVDATTGFVKGIGAALKQNSLQTSVRLVGMGILATGMVIGAGIGITGSIALASPALGGVLGIPELASPVVAGAMAIFGVLTSTVSQVGLVRMLNAQIESAKAVREKKETAKGFQEDAEFLSQLNRELMGQFGPTVKRVSRMMEHSDPEGKLNQEQTEAVAKVFLGKIVDRKLVASTLGLDSAEAALRRNETVNGKELPPETAKERLETMHSLVDGITEDTVKLLAGLMAGSSPPSASREVVAKLAQLYAAIGYKDLDRARILELLREEVSQSSDLPEIDRGMSDGTSEIFPLNQIENLERGLNQIQTGLDKLQETLDRADEIE